MLLHQALFKKLAAISMVIAFCGAAWAQSASPVLTVEQARQIVAPFYDALNQPATKNVEELLDRATSPAWVSCGGNTTCAPRAIIIPAFKSRGTAIPDLKWEIKDVQVSGDTVIVRGEATGTPAGEFMGVPNGGKSFRIMSIDVHTIQDGRMLRSYHVEDWSGAARQLAAK
ncbi:MAG: ester cyclase [Pseudomonadota bacterium]